MEQQLLVSDVCVASAASPERAGRPSVLTEADLDSYPLRHIDNKVSLSG